MRRLFVLIACLSVAAPANAEWWEARTGHFIVYSESSASDAKQFAQKLERFDSAMRTLQNMPQQPAASDSERLTVFRFGNIGDIGRLAGSEGIAGFYIPRQGGSVAFTPSRSDRPEASILHHDSRTELDPTSVLLHEYTHHFMYQHFPAAYPTWYVEGFAETAATIDLHPDGSFHIGNPPQYRAEALFSPYLALSSEKMLTTHERPDLLDFYGSYTVGWLLNHYLTFSGERRGQLTKYLHLINTGTEPAAAARQAFGDLGQLDRDLLRYKTSRKLGGADVKPVNFTAPQATMRKLSDDEAAIMPERVRTARGVSLKQARDVVGDARRIAGQFPNSFQVQLELAEAALDAEDFTQADAAADRALAANPDSVPALVLKGRVALERGKTNKALLPGARSWFAKAFDGDPHNPAPLYYNYLSYYEQGGPIPENVLVGLEHAFTMAMFDRGIRLALARQLLAEGKGDLGKSILQPLALNPHESKSAEDLDKVIDLIDSNKTRDAYAMLASKMKEWEDKAKKGE